MKKPIISNKLILLFYLFFMVISAQAQHSITGNFPPLAGQQVRLVGFNGFGIYAIDSTKIPATSH